MVQDRNESQSIRNLQRMLDQLSRRHTQLPRLVETGVFDELTLEAVMIFQRDFGLPVTGVVDHDSWYAVVSAYQKDLLHFGAPSPLRALPNGEFNAGAVSGSEPVRLAQTVLCALSSQLANFPLCQESQTDQEAARTNFRVLQRLADLPETGALDRATWEFLARLYHMYVTRDALSVHTERIDRI